MSDSQTPVPVSPGEEQKPDVEALEETSPVPTTGEEHPRGTLFLMLLFLMLIIAMWGYVYLIMIARS